MTSIPISRRTVLEATIIGAALSAALFWDLPASWKGSLGDTSSWDDRGAVFIIEDGAAAETGHGLPVRLKIPKINVDSFVEYVGLAANGTMDVPKNREDVAWFEPGTRPGKNGSAVIAGHYGFENKRGSAFDNLHRLRPGDRAYIEDSKGETISFVVRESRRYNPKADTAGIFSSNDGVAHLNLITCEGVWDEALGGYPKRLVVFMDREME